MNKILATIIFYLVAIAAFFNLDSIVRILQPTPCDVTREYSMGRFDNQYGISREEFLKVVSQAENVWEKELGVNLFQYNPEAEFKINLIFDQRKKDALEEERMAEKISETKEAYDSLASEYKKTKLLYDEKNKNYEKELGEYEDDLENFNKEVEKWNEKGEISEDDYNKLVKTKEDLEKTRKKLEKERDEVNALTNKINSLVKKEESLVDIHNANVETYQEKFGKERRFDQGDYQQGQINVYYFDEENDLELVLAHEFGHALGIMHLEKTNSIMYYLMKDQDLMDIKLSDEDKDAIKEICKLK